MSPAASGTSHQPRGGSQEVQRLARLWQELTWLASRTAPAPGVLEACQAVDAVGRFLSTPAQWEALKGEALFWTPPKPTPPPIRAVPEPWGLYVPLLLGLVLGVLGWLLSW